MTSVKKGSHKRKAKVKAGAIVFTAREKQMLSDIRNTLVEEMTARVATIADSLTKHLEAKLMQLGIVNVELHSLQHDTLTAVLPWIQSKVEADKQKAEFWEKMSKIAGHVLENVLKDSLVTLLKYALVAILLGAVVGSYHDVLGKVIRMLMSE